jgi:hypothetical protein
LAPFFEDTAMIILRGIAAAAVFAFAISAFSNAADSCDRQLVMQIDSAKISLEPDGFEISAFGTSESAGWKDPTLVVSGAITNGIATVDFVACRPEASAQVLTPIQTRALLDLDFATTRQVVIRARTNSMTVDISAE